MIKNISPNILIIICILLLNIQLTAQNTSANLLINGSFEEGPKAGHFLTFTVGQKLPGWIITKGTIDLNGSYMQSAEGKQCLDMNGTPGFGAIEQTFFTEKGKRYLVSFYLAGNPAGGPEIKKLLVTAGNHAEMFEFNIKGKKTDDMGWQRCEMVFKAVSRKTTLRFESPSNYIQSNHGAALDHVVVTKTKKKVTKNFNAAQLNDGVEDDKNEINAPEKNHGKPFFTLDAGLFGSSSFYFLNKEKVLGLIDYNNSLYDLQANKANWGIHAGVFAQFGFGPIMIRPELRFSSTRIEYQLAGNPAREAMERYQILDIPFLFGYQYNGFKFLIGPSGHLFLAKQSTLKDLGDFKTGIKRFTYGYEIGAGYQYKKIMLDLRFVGNMSLFGDGVLIKSKKYYFTDIPRSLLITISYKIN